MNHFIQPLIYNSHVMNTGRGAVCMYVMHEQLSNALLSNFSVICLESLLTAVQVDVLEDAPL